MNHLLSDAQSCLLVMLIFIDAEGGRRSLDFRSSEEARLPVDAIERR